MVAARGADAEQDAEAACKMKQDDEDNLEHCDKRDHKNVDVENGMLLVTSAAWAECCALCRQLLEVTLSSEFCAVLAFLLYQQSTMRQGQSLAAHSIGPRLTLNRV